VALEERSSQGHLQSAGDKALHEHRGVGGPKVARLFVGGHGLEVGRPGAQRLPLPAALDRALDRGLDQAATNAQALVLGPHIEQGKISLALSRHESALHEATVAGDQAIDLGHKDGGQLLLTVLLADDLRSKGHAARPGGGPLQIAGAPHLSDPLGIAVEVKWANDHIGHGILCYTVWYR